MIRPTASFHMACGHTVSLSCVCVSVCLLLLDSAKACSNVAWQGDFERLIWSLDKGKISYTLH